MGPGPSVPTSLASTHWYLAPGLVCVLVPLLVPARIIAAAIHACQPVRIAQRLLGEGLIPPAALVATFRFPLVLVTPVKLAFTCCKHSTGTCEPLVKPNVPQLIPDHKCY